MYQKKTLTLAFYFFLVLTFFFLSKTSGLIETPAQEAPGIELQVITTLNSIVYGTYESAFLSLHPEVVDIKWLEVNDFRYWKEVIDSPAYSIDLIWGGTQDNFEILLKNDFLLPLADPVLSDFIRQNISQLLPGRELVGKNASDDIFWTAANLHYYGLLVNHQTLEDYNLTIPDSWEDLASPHYFLATSAHAIGLPTENMATIVKLYHFFIQKYGWEAGWDIITRMVGNSRIYTNRFVDARDSVILGLQAIALTLDHYVFQEATQIPEYDFIIPDGEIFLEIEPIGIAKSSLGENSFWAEEFIRFVLSPEGQALGLNLMFNRLPVLPAAFNKSLEVNGYAREDLYQTYREILNAPFFAHDKSISSDIYDVFSTYFVASLTGPHPELVLAWSKLVEVIRTKEISEEEFRSLARDLGAPSFSLAQAKILQNAIDNDSNLIDTYKTQFQTEALDRYAGLEVRINTEKNDIDNDSPHFNAFNLIIQNPANNTVIEETLELQVKITDYREYSFLYSVTQVEVFIDDFFVTRGITPDYQTSGFVIFNFHFNVSDLSEGFHTLNILAYEYASQEDQIRITSGSIQVYKLASSSLISSDNNQPPSKVTTGFSFSLMMSFTMFIIFYGKRASRKKITAIDLQSY